ncbi:hypothetical protein AA0242T_0372 [Acetobacter aceti NRIC 0242]|uniref:Uncharacterized protein n=1 Tax=Acetobacter aceti NBRC 14818 TaxID=887700 RepID=A0AB33IFJ2_ACEAC|nr:hypothetical protein [Acetobacter aceti]TCS34491.1 hypothetical protein EDC15_10391 [Acetobacter aceti NBRC 14818]BCK76920.1 hypothetical protein EMQ_2526 [Acetobacter aceti NBRC 14818]GAN56361.1 hypothetical protein Abac_006_089 [Acetobacter aceti NBRC 14818]GBO79670.1 hypothetical protein AA0242T_0372 [Acetobacter aceti NRIC 0242]
MTCSTGFAKIPVSAPADTEAAPTLIREQQIRRVKDYVAHSSRKPIRMAVGEHVRTRYDHLRNTQPHQTRLMIIAGHDPIDIQTSHATPSGQMRRKG